MIDVSALKTKTKEIMNTVTFEEVVEWDRNQKYLF